MVFRLLFGLSAPVNRKAYLWSGVSLMALKVLIDNAVFYSTTGRVWPLDAYLLPSGLLRGRVAAEYNNHASTNAMLMTLAVLALPFMWIGVSMSVRRAADAGLSPFYGFAFLVPLVNYILMIALAVLPSASRESRWQWQSPKGGEPAPDLSRSDRSLGSASKATLLALLTSVGLGLAAIVVSVRGMEFYGTAMFFGTPFVMGVVSAIAFNTRGDRSLAASIGLSLLSIVVTGSALLLFAIEGLICIVMAAPLAGGLAVLGAVVGYAITQHARRRTSDLYAVAFALPLLMLVERATAKPELREVVTSVEIDAPPERVWPNVIGFTELPPPSELTFRLGIAHPMRATIRGEGVGAVRHCEFSTGPFVEPITAWEPPRRLAFSVESQPPSMTEMSPYRDIKAAHLEGYMVSRRGEFRLVPLEGGRTRLEGSTWYTLAIFPEAYWTMWSDALLHAIHGRVLRHTKGLSERAPVGPPR